MHLNASPMPITFLFYNFRSSWNAFAMSIPYFFTCLIYTDCPDWCDKCWAPT